MLKLYSFLYIFILIFISLISIFLCLFVFFITRDTTIANLIARFWGKALVKTALVKVEIIKKFNEERLKNNYILMSNHASAFDIFVLYGYLPFDFTFLSKKEVFKIPLFGIAMRVVGAIAVDRDNPAKLRETIKAMERYVAGGRSLLIFPEGTRSEKGELLPFKKGGFLLAKKSKTMILPITLINTNKVLKKGSFFINPFKNVKIILDEPIAVENKNLNLLMEQVSKIMQKNLEQYS